MKTKLLILLCAVIFTSCTVEKITSKKTYVCYETFPCGEIVVHRFVNLTLTEGLQYKFDAVKYKPGDTIIITKYRSKGLCGIFNRRLTTFTQYKNGNE